MKIGSLTGTIMCYDDELCRFSIDGDLVLYEALGTCAKYTPVEFRDGYNARAVKEFIVERLPEDNRHGLLESCRSVGIRMIGADILRYNNGVVHDDPCWIRYEEGPQTYEECMKSRLSKKAY